MKIKLFTTLRFDGVNVRPGNVVDVSSDEAERIVGMGQATFDLDAPVPVVASTPAPEVAPKFTATKRKSAR